MRYHGNHLLRDRLRFLQTRFYYSLTSFNKKEILSIKNLPNLDRYYSFEHHSTNLTFRRRNLDFKLLCNIDGGNSHWHREKPSDNQGGHL